MPGWQKSDLKMLRDLRSRHSAADISRMAANQPSKNGKAGRPTHNREDVMVNTLDFFRAVELRLQDGNLITRAYRASR